MCCLTRYKSVLKSNYEKVYDICVVKYYLYTVSQVSFKGAWTFKINCNKHWLNKIYFVVKKKYIFTSNISKNKNVN